MVLSYISILNAKRTTIIIIYHNSCIIPILTCYKSLKVYFERRKNTSIRQLNTISISMIIIILWIQYKCEIYFSHFHWTLWHFEICSIRFIIIIYYAWQCGDLLILIPLFESVLHVYNLLIQNIILQIYWKL